MGRTFVIEPPDNKGLLDLPDAKEHLRILHNDDDGIIADCIRTAIATLDGPGGLLGRAIGTQVLEHRADAFSRRLVLPYPPANNRTPVQIVSIKYLDGSDDEITVAEGSYRIDGRYLIGKPSWPLAACSPEAVRIRYQTGCAIEDVDPSVRAIVKMMVADLMRFPESVVVGTIVSELQLTTATRSLIGRLRPDVLA